MKKLSAILLALVFAIPATASVRVYNNANLNLGSQNSIQCGGNIACSLSAGKLLLDVDSTLNTMRQTQSAGTTAALTSAACGTTIVSDSADVQVLPEASTVLGCRITFVCGTADDYDVNPADATDTIGRVSVVTGSNTTAVLTPSAGDAIRCTDIGSSIMLEAVGNDLWAAIGGSNGIWTDVN